MKRLIALLGTCVLALVLCELGAAWAAGRLKSRRGVRDDVRAAIAMSGPGSVLVVGNSLVLHGINVPVVEQAMGRGYKAAKVAIVDSGYLDWLYGISSLFDRGSRPETIVLAISPAQFVADHPPTGASARMVWTIPNLWRYARDRRPGLTAISDRLFDHVSEFFAVRSRVRQDARRFIVPGYERMSREYLTSPVSTDTILAEATAEARLRSLDSLCARRGARFVYLLIPTSAASDRALEQTVISAGEQAGVPVLAPVSNGAVNASWLLDGYHLNALGASTFSTRAGLALAAELAERLADRRARRMQ